MSYIKPCLTGTANASLVAFAFAVATSAGPAVAGETRSGFSEDRLTSNFVFNATRPPIDGSPFQYHQYEVLGREMTLQAGERRRITGQLALSLETQHPQSLGGQRIIPYRNAETNSIVTCSYLNTETNSWEHADATSAGTNHPGTPGHVVVFSNSLLLKADRSGLYRCALVSYASHSRTHDFYGLVHASDSFLQISTGDEKGAEQFVHASCSSKGDIGCEYLPRKRIIDIDDPDAPPSPPASELGDPKSLLITTDRPKLAEDAANPEWYWSAAEDATHMEVMGTYQVTSCPFQTSSCISWYWGPESDLDYFLGTQANFASSVHFDQLYPDGSVCKANQSPSKRYAVSNDAHHFPVNYRLSIPVSQTCQGSRKFRVAVEFKWESGDPLKIDGGIITVINAVRNDTATVPAVNGMLRDQAIAILQGSGFNPAIVGVINPAPVGLVLDQNAPAGVVEPAGSTVNVAVSLGSTTVPAVVGTLEAGARSNIMAAGLTLGTVTRPSSCVDPGIVQNQSPAPGTTVALYTPVTLSVPACTRRPGGGGGNPVPK